jgi:phosphoglycolate phosphatase-like HAD superfamily hydrolase
VVGYPSVIAGTFTLMAVRHWATLVSNRKLLANLMRIYQFIFLIMFIMTLWLTCAVFLIYRSVKDWNATAQVASMRPYLICSMIFLLPYVVIIFLYTLDVSYLTNEIENGGNIEELNPPSYARDLSDVSLFQTCICVCGMPIILMIQCSDLFRALHRTYQQVYRDAPTACFRWPECCLKHRTVPAAEELKKPKKKSIWHRFYRTILRCFRGTKPRQSVLPDPTTNTTPIPPTGLALKELDKDREAIERNQREINLQEQDAERQRLALKEAEEAAEFQRRRKQEIEAEALRLEQARLQREQEEEEKRIKEEFAQRWQSVLSVSEYKSLWSTMPTSGSFQCNLRAMPELNAMVDHLKKQGFHVVFALNPSAHDIEIGICNIRPVGEESWFLSRFLVAQNSFSAVMKSNNAQLVPTFVKKFALAKILKLEGK